MTMSRQRRGGCQPGAAPRESCPKLYRPPWKGGGRPCAPSGRTAIDGFRNPGRCPGL